MITDFSGDVVYETRKAFKPPRGRQAVLDEILGFLTSSLQELKPRFPRLLGIGLAASGVIDIQRGMILHYDLIPQLVNIPIRDLIAEHFQIPCVMENNIRAMTLAEWTNGAAKGLRSFICMAVRSGVGAGVVIDGRLHAGSHGFCGEVGYMIIPGSGSASQWNNLQQTVSETALSIDVEAAEDLDEPTSRRAGEIIASQLASMAVLLDPQAIVLAGGILDPHKPLWRHVTDSFRRLVLVELSERLPLLPDGWARLPRRSGRHRCLYELFPVASHGR